jgi:hypothetical protein
VSSSAAAKSVLRAEGEGQFWGSSRLELLTEFVSPHPQSDTNPSTSTTFAIWLGSFIDS